jgi:hypothetical protein
VVGPDGRSESDEHELAVRRLTAAAYGFATWSEFRAWRKRNPVEYRERSRQLVDFPGEDSGIVIDLFAQARQDERRRRMATQEPGTTPDRPAPEEPMPAEPGTMPEHEPETAPEPSTMPEEPDVDPSPSESKSSSQGS